MKDVRQVYISTCCGADTDPCELVITGQERGWSRHCRNKCKKCGDPCQTVLGILYDSFGIRVLPGDIIELVDTYESNPWRYHAVFRNNTEERAIGIEIRDLNANNVYMWDPPIRTLGPYWENLGVLDDDDLSWYFGVTRDEAQEMAKRYSRREVTKE